MTSKKAGYSDDVWRAIRLLWEASPPTVSWRVILEQVASALNCEVPSIAAASTRCKSETWLKSVKKGVKKGVKNSVKNMNNFNPEKEIENQIKTVIYGETLNPEKEDSVEVKSVKKSAR